MKIKSENYFENIDRNIKQIKIIFFYGPNLGLIDLLYNKTISILKIDTNDPFNVSKIDGSNFYANPDILEDNINTLNIFSEKKFILLNLSHISINKNLENSIFEAITKESDNYLLIIKAGNLRSQNKLIKHLEKSDNCILTPCYEENINIIKKEISGLFIKHKISFSNDFISHLSSLFNADSLTNKMELEKLDNFLINNTNVTESTLLKFLINNEEVNLNKIIKACSNGETQKSLSYLDKIYEKSNSNIILIKMFGKHFKTIEKLLISNQHGKNLSEAINDIKPPIFFKDKPFILSQCKIWSFKKINLILKRLTDLEFKTKKGLYPEKTLLSQFILSVSVLVKKNLKT